MYQVLGEPLNADDRQVFPDKKQHKFQEKNGNTDKVLNNMIYKQEKQFH